MAESLGEIETSNDSLHIRKRFDRAVDPALQVVPVLRNIRKLGSFVAKRRLWMTPCDA